MDSSRAVFIDVFESFPFDTETDDGFIDGIVFVAIDLPLRPMVVGEIVEEAIFLLLGALEIFDAVRSEEEFLGTGIILRSNARST